MNPRMLSVKRRNERRAMRAAEQARLTVARSLLLALADQLGVEIEAWTGFDGEPSTAMLTLKEPEMHESLELYPS